MTVLDTPLQIGSALVRNRLYRAPVLRVNLLVWHNWNNTGMIV